MKVEIADYNPAWPVLYNQEKIKILEACGDKVHSIEHIGSTSVPTLGAKPIIDILLGVTELQNAIDIIPVLEKLGYNYRSDFEHTMPYRRYFSKPDECHIHAVEILSEFWKRHLLFRDYLRTHSNSRDDYYKLKLDLARRDWDDRNDYAYAKTEFVRGIEKKAFEEISEKCELAEAEADYDSFNNLPRRTIKECGLMSAKFGDARAIRSDAEPIILLNRVMALGLRKEINDELLDNIINFYGNDKKFALQIAPHLVTGEIKGSLAGRGFKYTSDWVKFYRPAEHIKQSKTELEIREISAGQAQLFADLVCTVYNMPDMFKPQFEVLIGRPEWKHFMAFDNNLPAAAASLFINGDTGWLGIMATLPEQRKKGAQSALITARIKAAHAAGCKWLSVETGPNTPEHPNPSYRNILKHGFRQLYLRPNYILNKAN